MSEIQFSGIELQNFLAESLVILLSVLNLRRRQLNSLLLTGVNGLHLTVLLFLGIGPFFYTFFGLPIERVNHDVIQEKIAQIYPSLIIGYAIVSLFEYKYIKKGDAESIRTDNLLTVGADLKALNLFNFLLLLFSFTGLYFSESKAANSGVGTLIPVIANLLYPVCILIAYKLEKKDKWSIYIFALLVIMVGVKAASSSWRSQLIFLIISLLIGFSLRRKINYWILGSVTIAIMLFILPFQQIKKYRFAEFDFDAKAAFEAGLHYSMEERVQTIGTFFAERINYMREMGYVQNAIENKSLLLRGGATYEEMILQLIPRFFWPGKPSYNQFTGYEVPRAVLLLSDSDESTSWAVTAFAEFVYNFDYRFIFLFIVILYFLLRYLDRLVKKMNLLPQYAWLLQATLFFLSLNLVSVIYSSTYFLWTFILIKILNIIKENKNESVAIR